MEITKEIKAKVFAQYLGQRTVELYIIEPFALHDIINGKIKAQIILKPLSQVSDEDAIEVARLKYKNFKHHEPSSWIRHVKNFYLKNTNLVNIQTWQFLQSKGYDLPHYLLGGKTLKEAGLAVYE